MQSKEDLEAFYETVDPWEYEKYDWERREWILAILNQVKPSKRFYRALDIGCGEGFISDELPALHIYGTEISDNAAKRLRDTKRVVTPKGKYDLVTACGVLYPQYNYSEMKEIVQKHASNIVLTAHYDQAGEAQDYFEKPQIFYAEFPYRNGKQVVRVYDFK